MDFLDHDTSDSEGELREGVSRRLADHTISIVRSRGEGEAMQNAKTSGNRLIRISRPEPSILSRGALSRQKCKTEVQRVPAPTLSTLSCTRLDRVRIRLPLRCLDDASCRSALRTNEQACQTQTAGTVSRAQARRLGVADLGSCGATHPGSSPGARIWFGSKELGARCLSHGEVVARGGASCDASWDGRPDSTTSLSPAEFEAHRQATSAAAAA